MRGPWNTCPELKECPEIPSLTLHHGHQIGAMGPQSQPYFMDLVRVGEFVQAMDMRLAPLGTAKIEV